MARGRSPITLLALALLGAGVARAQDEPRFREVEAGVEDVGSGAVSTLLRPVDLREPMNFERVYEIVDSGLFARRAGALTAVFDRSLYVGGRTPVIPPGTVFYLGSLPVDLGRPGRFAPRAVAETGAGPARLDTRWAPPVVGSDGPPVRVARRVDLRVDAEDTRTGPPVADLDRNFWTDEAFRQRRVGEVIRGAAWRARQIRAQRGADDENR